MKKLLLQFDFDLLTIQNLTQNCWKLYARYCYRGGQKFRAINGS